MSDSHKKHVDANRIFLDEFLRTNIDPRLIMDIAIYGQCRTEMTVNDWLNAEIISKNIIDTVPNAKAAAEIKASPLFKALE